MTTSDPKRDERKIYITMDGHPMSTPTWMVEKLYNKAVAEGKDERAEYLLDRLTSPDPTGRGR